MSKDIPQLDQSVDHFSMSNPSVAACPYAYYQAMRQQEPVHRDPGLGFYWVASHEAVTREAMNVHSLSSTSAIVLKKTFRPRAQALWEAANMQAIDTLVTSDPPDHDNYRSLAMSLFTPKKVLALLPAIEARIEVLIDEMLSADSVDFVKAFASRLPATVMCDEFGFPPEEQPQFTLWSDAFMALLNPIISEDQEVEMVKDVIELFKYLDLRLQRAAREPSGRVIDAIATMPRRDGTPFTMLERGWLALVTFVGGNETTINMLAAGVKRFAVDQNLQDRLRANPDLMPAFIEELMRLDSSVQVLFRVAKHDMQLDGVAIPAGSNVMLCTASANRDEKRWKDPDTFQLDRPDSRQHLGFGWGRHSCIGMHLARSELRVAFNSLLRRLDRIELAVPLREVEQLPLPFNRAMAKLPIQYKARS